ncbi:MAG: hypothetical protein IKR23_11375, partial [Lachnospiraceae bacterium]|nr:hypothetical protein [Lachnospiraceae bacterium]
MADVKRTQKNVPGKKKRKLNSKGRTLVRCSVGGVLLASALIIAAIPSDRSGKAQASITSEQEKVFEAINMLNGVNPDGTFLDDSNMYTGANTGLVYENDRAHALPVQKDNNAPDLSLAIPGHGSTQATGWSLTIDNSNYVQNMFKYYEAPAANNPSQMHGVICDHNRDLGSSNAEVYIASTICGNYDFYSDTFYENFLDTKYRDYKFVVFDP